MTKPVATLSRHRSLLRVVTLAAIATAARLVTWQRVFTSEGIRFVADSDTHYHVLRARQVLEGQFSRFDDGINFPLGAKVLWPPLFDHVLAIAPALGLDLEGSAAVLPVVFGVATTVVFHWVASLFAPRRLAFAATVLFTLSPGALGFTLLGRPDQHVIEGLLILVVAGAFVTGRSVMLGAALALSFANWQGSGVYLVVLGTFVAIWFILRDAMGAGTLAKGSLLAAAMLAVALTVLCRPALTEMTGFGVTGFHVLLLTTTGLFAATIAVAGRRSRPRWSRAAIVVGAAVIAGGALVLLGGSGLATNLLAVGAANRWYQNIQEWQPLFSGQVLRDLAIVGGAGVIAPVAFLAVVRHRGDPFRMAFLGTWGILFLFATVARQRFTLYLAAPAAIWAVLALERAAGRLRARWAVPAGVFALSLPSAFILVSPMSVKGVEPMMPALRWLRTVPPRPQQEAILADWALGTVTRYYSGRPVLTNPAGTDGGVDVMEDAARFYLAVDEQQANAALRARRIGYVFVQNPMGDAFISGAYRQPDCVALASRSAALITYAPADTFWNLPLARLYFLDGLATERGAALTTFRLLFETNPESFGPPPLGMYKLFGVVPGAILKVRATPGESAVVSVPLATNVDRRFAWSTRGVADSSGVATLRVPYATGMNGFVQAGPCAVYAGGRLRQIDLAETDVTNGTVITITP